MKKKTVKEQEYYKPDWTPENAGQEFAIRIVKGVENSNPDSKSFSTKKRTQLSVDDYVKGVLEGDRTILARTITLIESNSPSHQETASEVLKKILPYSGNSLRIGITGVPGAGKSTFIESLGVNLVNSGHKVAVLAVDPSSTVTKGSILGDKTRMEKLAREPNCFIRPSPSGGTLGGVTRKSREIILVCEAAGFDVILLETVGVGQSEVTVRSMVDFFLLLLIAGAGDELQGIKKGVIELADAILINKADGDNKIKAKIAKTDYSNALKYLQPATKGWRTEAYTCSAINGEGIDEIWNVIKDFEITTKKNGIFVERRKQQILSWITTMVDDSLRELLNNNLTLKKIIPQLEQDVLTGKLLAPQAAEMIIKLFKESLSHKQ